MAQTAARSFTGWYDAAAITAWAAALATRIEALQRLTAQTTDAYLARVLSLLAGRRVPPTGRIDTSGLRRGVTHAGAYARAADVYRWQQHQFDQIAINLARGTLDVLPDIIDPIDAAVQRVIAVAATDIQLADRAQTSASYAAAGDKGLITGWRRVIHPELSKGGACGLCVAASDRLYGVHEPKAIHDRCECTTLPVLDANDPGSTLNDGDLGRLYGDAGGTHRSKLKATRYQVDEHGELGPVLNPAGAKVRTAREAERDQNRARRARTDAEKAAQIRRVEQSLKAALPAVQARAGNDPKTWGDYLAKLEDRIADLDHQLAA